jgi:hypothetical protein
MSDWSEGSYEDYQKARSALGGRGELYEEG